MRAIHWFRSDLRIADNTALADACRRADALAPVFVLDDALLARHRDAHPRLRFLHACLDDLASALEAAGSRLIVLRGAPHRCLPALARACRASLVTWNRDYGPHAKERDRRVRDALAHDRGLRGTCRAPILRPSSTMRASVRSRSRGSARFATVTPDRSRLGSDTEPSAGVILRAARHVGKRGADRRSRGRSLCHNRAPAST